MPTLISHPHYPKANFLLVRIKRIDISELMPIAKLETIRSVTKKLTTVRYYATVKLRIFSATHHTLPKFED